MTAEQPAKKVPGSVTMYDKEGNVLVSAVFPETTDMFAVLERVEQHMGLAKPKQTANNSGTDSTRARVANEAPLQGGGAKQQPAPPTPAPAESNSGQGVARPTQPSLTAEGHPLPLPDRVCTQAPLVPHHGGLDTVDPDVSAGPLPASLFKDPPRPAAPTPAPAPQQPPRGVRDTSMHAYRALQHSGKLAALQQKIVDYFLANPGMRFTRMELAKDLGIEINSCTGRVAELIREPLNVLEEEDEKKKCRITGNVVNALVLAKVTA